MTAQSDPRFTRVGEDFDSPERKAEWLNLVTRLDALARPGQPFEDWLFHGTSGSNADLIMSEGMNLSPAQVSLDDQSYSFDDAAPRWFWSNGTHWASPLVAAYYAEDTLLGNYPPEEDIAIIVIRRKDLESCGELVVDGQTVDSPIFSRLALGRGAEDEWDSSSRTAKNCLRIFETVVCLGAPSQDMLHEIRTMDDLNRLLCNVAPQSGPNF
jgi:hypothetical protein